MRLRGCALAVAGVLAVCAVAAPRALADGTRAAASGGHGGKVGPPLSANEYFTLMPFVLPIVERREIAPKQFTLVLALKLADEDARGEVSRRAARIRDTLYTKLYRLISFRTRKRRLVDKDELRRALEPLALDAAGRDYVTELVVQQAYLGNAPR